MSEPVTVEQLRESEQRIMAQLRRLELQRGGDKGFFSLAEVASMTTLSEREVWRRVEAGEFPAPRVLGDKRRAWSRKKVIEWLDARPEYAGPAATTPRK